MCETLRVQPYECKFSKLTWQRLRGLVHIIRMEESSDTVSTAGSKEEEVLNGERRKKRTTTAHIPIKGEEEEDYNIFNQMRTVYVFV